MNRANTLVRAMQADVPRPQRYQRRRAASSAPRPFSLCAVKSPHSRPRPPRSSQSRRTRCEAQYPLRVPQSRVAPDRIPQPPRTSRVHGRSPSQTAHREDQRHPAGRRPSPASPPQRAPRSHLSGLHGLPGVPSRAAAGCPAPQAHARAVDESLQPALRRPESCQAGCRPYPWKDLNDLQTPPKCGPDPLLRQTYLRDHRPDPRKHQPLVQGSRPHLSRDRACHGWARVYQPAGSDHRPRRRPPQRHAELPRPSPRRATPRPQALPCSRGPDRGAGS
jgi:hypothetical protein